MAPVTTSNVKRSVRRAVAVVVAASFGAAVSVVVTHLVVARPASAVRSAASDPTGASAAEPNANPAKLDALEARLRMLESRATDPALLSVTHVAPVAKDPGEPASADRLAKGREQQQQIDGELHGRCDGEQPDPKWARGAAATIRETLGERARRGSFAIGEVNCKTTMCMASVSWPSYAAAHQEFRSLLALGGGVH